MNVVRVVVVREWFLKLPSSRGKDLSFSRWGRRFDSDRGRIESGVAPSQPLHHEEGYKGEKARPQDECNMLLVR